MSAIQFFESKYPHSHTLPKTSILELMEQYAELRHQEYLRKKETFNTEMFMAKQKLDQYRKKSGDTPIQDIP